MKKNLLLISMMLVYSYSKGQTFDTLATFEVPNQLALGVTFDYVNNYYIVSSGGQSNAIPDDNIFLRYDLNGVLVDSFPEPFTAATSGFGIRDLAFDGTYIYGSYDNQVQLFDNNTFTPFSSFTGLNNPNRGMAVDTDLTVYSTNFTGGPIAHFTNTGAYIDSCTRLSVVGSAPYGLAVDNWTMPGTKRLWMNTPSLAGAGMFLTRFDYASCLIDTNVDLSVVIPSYADLASLTSGGLDIINNHPNYPGKIIALVLGQNNPTAFVMLVDMTLPVGINENNAATKDFEISNLYPVPAKDKLTFTLSSKDECPVSVSMKDNIGREVLMQQFKSIAGENTITLDLAKQAAGIYFITVSNGKSVVNSKFVKE